MNQAVVFVGVKTCIETINRVILSHQRPQRTCLFLGMIFYSCGHEASVGWTLSRKYNQVNMITGSFDSWPRLNEKEKREREREPRAIDWDNTVSSVSAGLISDLHRGSDTSARHTSSAWNTSNDHSNHPAKIFHSISTTAFAPLLKPFYFNEIKTIRHSNTSKELIFPGD